MVRPKHLHSFNLPPGLRWGKQKLLKCINVNPVPARPPVDDNDSEEYNRFQEERSSDDQQKRIDFKLKSPSASPSKSLQPLRTSVCKVETEDDRSEKKPMRPRRNLDKKEERPKFSITLSRKEIEDDFIDMTGKKPPRKPKPPKSVQMKLGTVFPGSWLSEVHPDRYKVDESGKI